MPANTPKHRSSARKDPGRAAERVRCCFIHIPKCGGTSVRNFLDKRFSGEKIFSFNNHDFLMNNLAIIGNYDIVMGHISYRQARLVGSDFRIITLLRDPVSRVLSSYLYARSQPESAVDSGDRFLSLARSMDLRDFVESADSTVLADLNLMTYYLALGPGYNPNELLGDGVLETAKANLASLDCFGITDRLPEFLELVSHRFGWIHVPTNDRLNVSGAARTELSPEIKDLLHRKCHLDIALYEFAAKEFERRYKDMQRGPTPDGRYFAPPRSAFAKRIDCRFDGPFSASGWWHKERLTENNPLIVNRVAIPPAGALGRFYCWTMAPGPSRMVFPMTITGKAITIRVHGIAAATDVALRTVVVRLNGEKLPHRIDSAAGTGFDIKASADGRDIGRGRHLLEISIASDGHARLESLSRQPSDDGQVGLAINRVRVWQE